MAEFKNFMINRLSYMGNFLSNGFQSSIRRDLHCSYAEIITIPNLHHISNH